MPIPTGLIIKSLERISTAREIGLAPGDEILSINGSPVPDYLAYRYLIMAEDVTILVRKKEGGLLDIDLEKDEDDDLGIVPPPMKVRCCNNKCVFCFVAQMPRGMRRSLYLKDEDYRHSFLYGNYITLTTLTEQDYQRIIREKLSPLYVSVHTTDEEMRKYLLGNPNAAPVMDGIKRLVDGGITLHTQAVICPGLNDGERLTRTLEDLLPLYPMVASLAVVPIGLTKHRKKLPHIDGFTKEQAGALLDSLEPYRIAARKEHGAGFVYPSDEFYIQAGRKFPRDKEYDGYPQIDNGVGLVRDFLTEFGREKRRLPAGLGKKAKVVLVTGVSFAPYLSDVAKTITGKLAGLELTVLPVVNDLFGESVTVTGLLCGRDIASALKGVDADGVFVPSVTMRDGDGVFLDDMTPEGLARETGLDIVMVEPTAAGLVDAVKEL
ncbi:MAG: DUF512 domain-containing protein [Nitrospirae bacterium]|nr:DUF512 domain-containing protein [Nitrospirota bacterium]